MRLYLARHGHAVEPSENPERPLSERGRTEVGRMASFLARAGVRVGRVLHSGKARAAQTALEYATVIGGGILVEETQGLKPNDDPQSIADVAETWETDALIAGHLPHLGRLTSLLLAGDSDLPAIDLGTGAMVCLERGYNGDGWRIAFALDPKLLG